jgi:hypothetical protein
MSHEMVDESYTQSGICIIMRRIVTRPRVVERREDVPPTRSFKECLRTKKMISGGLEPPTVALTGIRYRILVQSANQTVPRDQLT